MSDYKALTQDFFTIVKTELSNYMDSVNTDALVAAKTLIQEQEAKGKRVHVTGIGKPGHVAGYVASLMSSTGTPTYFLHGTECVHGSAGQVAEGDVVIAISNSGNTQELEASVAALIANKAKIIAVTGNPNSWLAKHADVALIAGVTREGDNMNKPPRASILVEILALQALSLLLQDDFGLTPETYVTWHPGGSLGASIRDAK